MGPLITSLHRLRCSRRRVTPSSAWSWDRFSEPRFSELNLLAPLRLGVTDQSRCGPASQTSPGRREIALFSRVDDASAAFDAESDPAHGCTSVRTSGIRRFARVAPRVATPEAEAIDAETFYERFADAGYSYGSAFLVVGEAWVRGAEVFAECVLPDREGEQASEFALHPALFDGGSSPRCGCLVTNPSPTRRRCRPHFRASGSRSEDRATCG